MFEEDWGEVTHVLPRCSNDGLMSLSGPKSEPEVTVIPSPHPLGVSRNDCDETGEEPRTTIIERIEER